MLKIWNLNKFSGVIGAFNCQGAGKWPCKDNTNDDNTSTSKSLAISGYVSPMDVEFLEELAGENWTGDCAVFAFNSGIVQPIIQLLVDIHMNSSCNQFGYVLRATLISLSIFSCFEMAHKWDMIIP